ncbi:SDR family oxidoreductase [Roseibium sp. M-1]
MTPDLSTAIVTGASKGIGAAIARRLSRDGFQVVINYGSNAAAAAALVQSLEDEGGKAIAVQGDVSEPATHERLFDAAERAFGPVGVLVNNAGTMRNTTIADASDEAFERQFAVNLGGVFRGMRLAANRIEDGGRIISLSSSVVGLYQPNYGLYASTKAAVEAMTKVLAKELGNRGIRVNAVAPGPVETDFFLAGKPPELVETIRRSNPLGRLGQPDDIAATVAFLAGPDGDWINGQTLRANGGII